jgi:hypothetical protein
LRILGPGLNENGELGCSPVPCQIFDVLDSTVCLGASLPSSPGLALLSTSVLL